MPRVQWHPAHISSLKDCSCEARFFGHFGARPV
jgi:hypothetical protein